MASGKEIRGKIKSVENTKKITKAMEMVAASKMRKAQDRMRAARPYAEKIRAIAANLGHANPEYIHPLMQRHDAADAVGFVVVTTDKGLCGGLNTNVLRAVSNQMREEHKLGKLVEVVAIGGKGVAFFNRLAGQLSVEFPKELERRKAARVSNRPIVLATITQLGDKPHMEKLIGAVKTMLDAYSEGRLSRVYLCYTNFINTMRQETKVEELLPLADLQAAALVQKSTWDYIYEPDAAVVIHELLQRYTETLVYQAVAENMASEQSARMVAMKAATDNAGNVISELRLVYNKTRQAAITKELSEIVAGAAAV